MKKFADVLRSGDWKHEKHVPTIVAPESAKAGDEITITVHVGSDIAHPNTTEHHIRWIKICFQPDNDNFTYELADFQFTAHGECVQDQMKVSTLNQSNYKHQAESIRDHYGTQLLQHPRIVGKLTENRNCIDSDSYKDLTDKPR